MKTLVFVFIPLRNICDQTNISDFTKFCLHLIIRVFCLFVLRHSLLNLRKKSIKNLYQRGRISNLFLLIFSDYNSSLAANFVSNDSFSFQENMIDIERVLKI